MNRAYKARNAQKTLFHGGNENMPCMRLKCISDCNIEADLGETGCEFVNSSEMTQGTTEWLILLYTI
jgi:hypothetical protein